MLADTLRLGEETAPADPFAGWQVPSVLPDPQRVKRVIAELERGLAPTRPEFLKWICGKLSALPSQTATGMNAALWADNVCDVCEGYPEDLLQSACLDLLKTRTFRPSPAEIVQAIERRHSERVRMLARAKRLLSPPKAAEPTEQPLATRAERLAHTRDTWRRLGRIDRAANAERELAREQEREPEDWARAASPRPGNSSPDAVGDPDSIQHRSATSGQMRPSNPVENFGKPAPEWRDEPVGDAHAA